MQSIAPEAPTGRNMEAERNALFISHANPEDNVFTMWLGSRLAAAGYDVWADILRLKGGQDWQRKLEDALRRKAAKVLLVGTEHGIEKQGVRNEIQIASDTAKKIGDTEFILPLRLTNFEAPFLIAHAQRVDFKRSWADGLAELLDLLETTYNVPKLADQSAVAVSHWRDVHLRYGRTLSDKPETLVSNWLRISNLPEKIYVYDFKSGISVGLAQAHMRTSPWPVAAFRRAFISFAPHHQLQDHFGPSLPLTVIGDCSSESFLKDGLPDQDIERFNAQNIFSNLVRQCIESFLKDQRLKTFEMSNNNLAWWGDTELLPPERIRFDWPNIKKGQRQLTGYSKVRNLYWHYGVSVKPRFFPFPHVRLIGRVIFSRDGTTPLDDPKRMFRLRRSATKGWRNAKWRDMQLAFLAWLSKGEDCLSVPASETATLQIALPPEVLVAPISLETEIEPVDDTATDEEELTADDDLEYLYDDRDPENEQDGDADDRD